MSDTYSSWLPCLRISVNYGPVGTIDTRTDGQQIVIEVFEDYVAQRAIRLRSIG